jgi:hypothetical protein
MTSFRPTKIEQLAIEAKLNFIFGAKVYDRVFLGFEVLEVVNDELRAWALSEHQAAVIDVRYSGKVAWIAQTVFNRPVRRVSVLHVDSTRAKGCHCRKLNPASKWSRIG